jgi:DNA-binding beta-propeller fold protein YncE
MHRLSLSLFALILLLLAGCATAPPPVKEPPVFYPGPPDPPRIQFLRSFSGSDDLVPPRSAFAKFVTGGRETIVILDKPYGIAGYKGKIYVCDTNATVMVLDLEKKTFAPMEGVHGLGKLMQPINISVDKDGNKYVADPVRGQVVMFDKNDFYVKAFGPVEGWKPVDAMVFEGLLYVVDEKNGEIKIFDIQSGSLRNSIGKKGEDAKGKLGLPTNIAFDKDGYLYVADVGRFQIVKLDRDGNSRGVIGSLGKVPGSFARPKGIALDRQNRLYAVDAAFNNIQIFTAEGQLLLFFSQAGKGPGDLLLPAKVAVDYDNVKYFQQYAEPNFEIEYLLLVTNQFSPRRINVYGFGKEKGRTYLTDEEMMKERDEKQQQEKLKEKQKEQEQEQQKEKEKQKEQQDRPQKTGDAEQKKSVDAEQKKN